MSRVPAASVFVISAASVVVQVGWAQQSLRFETSDSGECRTMSETWLSPRPVRQAAMKNPASQIAGRPVSPSVSCNSDPEADGPDKVVCTPDGSSVLVVHRETDNVTFLDVNTRTVTHTVTVGDFPTDIAVTPDGAHAVTTNVFTNDVSIIDIATHAV